VHPRVVVIMLKIHEERRARAERFFHVRVELKADAPKAAGERKDAKRAAG